MRSPSTSSLAYHRCGSKDIPAFIFPNSGGIICFLVVELVIIPILCSAVERAFGIAP